MTIRTYLIGVVVLACLIGLSVEPVFGQTRGISVNLRSSEKVDAPVVDNVELYGKSYALVIGIDDYNNGWPKLSNAIADAEAIAATLEARGFDVELHKNLGSAELDTVFKRFFILKGDDPSARLFIWFAGHGATVDGEGYLIPKDAPPPQSGAEFKYASIALRDFGTFMRQAVSKHVYAVFDSCFAGTVFSSQRAIPPAAITRATTLPVRQFLTSGDAEQTVSDDGAFRELFISAINGDERSDANGNGYVTASELGMFLGDRVTNLTQSLQTPRYGKLRDKNFDRGDFVFLLPEGAIAGALETAPKQPVKTSAELVFWQSIQNGSNADEFDLYLQQYPDGSFKGLAEVKRDQLRAADRKAKALLVPEKFVIESINQDLQANKVANVRQRPFPNAKRVARLEQGARVWAIGETRTKGGIWYQVARDGVELGFVYGPLLGSIGRSGKTVAVSALAVTPEKLVAESRNNSDEFSFLVDDLLEDTSTNQRTTNQASEDLFDGEPLAEEQFVTSSSDEMNKSVQLSTTNDVAQVADSRRASIPVENYFNSITEDVPATRGQMTTSQTTGDSVILKSSDIAFLNVSANKQVASSPLMTAETTIDDSLVSQTALTTSTVSNPSLAAVPTAQATEPSVNKDMNSYIERYRRIADSGNTKAQLSLGYMYETGEQVEMDKVEAANWYRRAAESGEVQAMISLGLLYEKGEGGVGQDLAEAAYWYRKAADSGDSSAQQTIAYMYEQGEGVSQDAKQAARWYEKAALQGKVTAQANLGRLYQLGIGVPKDTNQAIFWYEKAAAQGNDAARDSLQKLSPR